VAAAVVAGECGPTTTKFNIFIITTTNDNVANVILIKNHITLYENEFRAARTEMLRERGGFRATQRTVRCLPRKGKTRTFTIRSRRAQRVVARPRRVYERGDISIAFKSAVGRRAVAA